jgi:predicted RNA-binding protein YlxR (DUF448 family)
VRRRPLARRHRKTTATPEITEPEDELPDEPEKGPLRRCIVTRESQPKEQMLRFVLGPDRELVPDLAGRLPGRGMWLSAKADVLERALARGAFSKAARGPVVFPPDLRKRIEDGLRSRVRDLMGFARRGGQAVAGWQAVREVVLAGRVGLVVQASDGSLAERARVLGGRNLPVVAPLPGAALGAVFGRDHAVHVAVAPGRMAESIAAEAARLAGFQVQAEPGQGGDASQGPADTRV